MIYDLLNRTSNLNSSINNKIDCSHSQKTNYFENNVSNTNKTFYNETKASYTRPYWSYFSSHIVANSLSRM
ncbi:hypothetical protein RB653_001024 [Dictyostelium firmibasis]|uniref:Uncharacterized protein n=1 Tax=Dictyostelium firmibasis TaxID=79012 RepID=A0AAN7TXS7_9MYCE